MSLHPPLGNAAAKTLVALDTNKDGSVSPSEVITYAVSQGADAKTASKEFTLLDLNNDGTIDASELQDALDGDATAHAATTTPVMMQAQLTPTLQTGMAQSGKVVEQAPALVGGTNSFLAAVSKLTPQFVERKINSLAASTTANSVVEQLSLEARKEKAAEIFERHASELRANATILSAMTEQRALAAGMKAAELKANDLMQSLTKIEDEAKHNEVQAAKLRVRLQADVARSNGFMAVADAALKQ